MDVILNENDGRLYNKWHLGYLGTGNLHIWNTYMLHALYTLFNIILTTVLWGQVLLYQFMDERTGS